MSAPRVALVCSFLRAFIAPCLATSAASLSLWFLTFVLAVSAVSPSRPSSLTSSSNQSSQCAVDVTKYSCMSNKQSDLEIGSGISAAFAIVSHSLSLSSFQLQCSLASNVAISALSFSLVSRTSSIATLSQCPFHSIFLVFSFSYLFLYSDFHPEL